MTRRALAVAAGLSWLAAVSATNLRSLPVPKLPRSTASEGFVHVPVNAARKPDIDRLARRQTAQTAQTDLTNLGSGYTINISIAGQETSVILDTGSSELWVNPDCSTASRAIPADGEGDVEFIDSPATDPATCEATGRYFPDRSSTSEALGEGTEFAYADNTRVTANYYRDTLAIGGLTVTQQIFAVANASNATALGIMGIGPDSIYGFNRSEPYSFILNSMAEQGLINSRAFSLDLRDFDNTTGSLIFGGVDKSKYSGPLSKLPIQRLPVEVEDQIVGVWGYFVTVSSIGITEPSGSTSQYSVDGGSFIAVVDSGTSAILLPDGVSSEMCRDVNGTSTVASGTEICSVDCDTRGQPGGINFGFDGGRTIQVAYENLISTLEYEGNTFCYLDVATSTVATDPPTYILGAPFLRSAYAVFDWDNQAIHLAQAADCGSEIVAIGNGTDAVPTGDGNCGGSGSGDDKSASNPSRAVGASLLLAAGATALSMLV